MLNVYWEARVRERLQAKVYHLMRQYKTCLKEDGNPLIVNGLAMFLRSPYACDIMEN